MSTSDVTSSGAPSVESFARWTEQRLACVEAALAALLPAADEHPARLHEAMRYAVLGGGKRVRPLLVFAAGEAIGAPSDRLAAAACAVELIHAYSLVHDDLPCMDDDALRRGKPTVHLAYDEAIALLVGDALQSLAFEALARIDSPHVGRMCATLATASGSRGMAGGQAIDLDAVGKTLSAPALEDMHRRKTGALLQASVRLGALCAGRDAQTTGIAASLQGYAQAVGLAFQVVDDVLDVTGDAATLGKTAGKDADHDKPTYVSILGLEQSRQLAQRLHVQAIAALEPLGEAGRRLRALADLIVTRRA